MPDSSSTPDLPGTIRAVRFAGVGQRLRVQDLPTPVPDADGCLVRVGSVGLCGSDAHIISGHTKTGHLPITIGHEIAGTVLTAPGDSDIRPGDAVFVNPILGCERCRACARGETNLCPRRRMMGIQVDGGLTQVLAAPSRNLTRLPDDADLMAAPLIESAGTAHHALRAAAVSRADVVVVVGLGGLGMQVLRLALARGARVIGLDLDPVSRQRAVEAGATAAVDPIGGEARDALGSLDAGDGCDAVVDCVGFPSTIETALDLLRPGGRCVVVGIGATAPRLPPPGVFVRRSLTLSAVYAYSAADIAAGVGAVADGTLDLGPSVSRVVDLDSVDEAIADIEQRRGSPLRIMVDPWAGTPRSWRCTS